MSSRQLDEKDVYIVAREICDPPIRAMYLSQICPGEGSLRARIEQQLKHFDQRQARRRWRRFPLRALMIVILVVACLSAGIGISVRQTVRARRMAVSSTACSVTYSCLK